MREQTKSAKQRLTTVVTVRVRPVERLAIEQAAADHDTTVSRAARAAILRGLKATAK